jgi:hypothetical protein
MKMATKVKGFLASDGKFFERAPECLRHESVQTITALCESHRINPDNFFTLLDEWHTQISEYYNADNKCKEPRAIPKGSVKFGDDDIPSPDFDNEDDEGRDKDIPAFLEQQIRRNF